MLTLTAKKWVHCRLFTTHASSCPIASIPSNCRTRTNSPPDPLKIHTQANVYHRTEEHGTEHSVPPHENILLAAISRMIWYLGGYVTWNLQSRPCPLGAGFRDLGSSIGLRRRTWSGVRKLGGIYHGY